MTFKRCDAYFLCKSDGNRALLILNSPREATPASSGDCGGGLSETDDRLF